MKLLSTIVASGMFIAGLVALSNAGGPTPDQRAVLMEELNAANVSYVMDAAADRGVKIHVLTVDNVCEILAKHPEVSAEVYNAVEGVSVDCK